MTTWEDFYYVEKKYRRQLHAANSTYFRIREVGTDKKTNHKTYPTEAAAIAAAKHMFINKTHDFERSLGLR